MTLLLFVVYISASAKKKKYSGPDGRYIYIYSIRDMRCVTATNNVYLCASRVGRMICREFGTVTWLMYCRRLPKDGVTDGRSFISQYLRSIQIQNVSSSNELWSWSSIVLDRKPCPSQSRACAPLSDFRKHLYIYHSNGIHSIVRVMPAKWQFSCKK